MRNFLILLLAFFAVPAVAQTWQIRQSDDGGYAAAIATYAGLPFSVTCAARSVQNLPLAQTSWFESTVAPPWHFLFETTDALIPATTFERSDILIFADQNGYRLPPVEWNELDGRWQVSISITDPMIAALDVATRIVLQTGPQTAWEIPVDGFGTTLDQAAAYCAATWQATGHTIPYGMAGTSIPNTAVAETTPGHRPEIGVIAQRHIDRLCNGSGAAGKNGLAFGDMDGDGALDILVDWSDVTCAGGGMRPFCGASMCSGDILLGRNNYAFQEGDVILGGSHVLVPLDNGNMGVKSSGNLSMCQSTAPCGFVTYWDGTRLNTFRY
ncbi:MAG: hypothetical protein WBB25_12490 [Sulfitobacter sp.]